MDFKTKNITILILLIWIVSIFLTPIHFSSHIHITNSVNHKTHHHHNNYHDHNHLNVLATKYSKNSLISKSCFEEFETDCPNRLTILEIVDIYIGFKHFQVKIIKIDNFYHTYNYKQFNFFKKLYCLAPKHSPPYNI